MPRQTLSTYIYVSAMILALHGSGTPSVEPPKRSDSGAIPGSVEHTTTRSRPEAAATDLAQSEPPARRPLHKEQAAGPVVSVQDALQHNAVTAQAVTEHHARLTPIRNASQPADRERYTRYTDNPIQQVAQAPVSTFSIDVDTGSYSNVRRLLRQGQLPPQAAVRVEEMLNYFNYAYPAPEQATMPFRVTTEIAPTPWNSRTHLLHIGIQGYEVAAQDLPACNLVFLVDVSGSMQSPDKLELLKNGLKLLTRRLRAQDRLSIAVYAGASGVVLEPVAGNAGHVIEQALDGLTAGGSTHGAAGIRLAYQLAERAFIPDGINRVLLATDGDFNVGMTDHDALINLIEEKRRSGVSLTTLGFGSGNYNDALMEQLADAGNGNYAYIDTLNEAHKVLVEQAGATLHTIAKDVKIQIEFNPAQVAEYRLIGYENRMLAREDFNNDRVDAGDIGAGHSVTALYEIALVGSGGERIDPLRYAERTDTPHARDKELAYLRLRYKQPQGTTSRLLETPLRHSEIQRSLAQTSEAFRFAAAVAGFGQRLRGGEHMEAFDYAEILALARAARGHDPFGYRGEFVQLVSLAQALSQSTAAVQRDARD